MSDGCPSFCLCVAVFLFLRIVSFDVCCLCLSSCLFFVKLGMFLGSVDFVVLQVLLLEPRLSIVFQHVSGLNLCILCFPGKGLGSEA